MIIYDQLPVASGNSLTRVGQEHFCLGPGSLPLGGASGSRPFSFQSVLLRCRDFRPLAHACLVTNFDAYGASILGIYLPTFDPED